MSEGSEYAISQVDFYKVRMQRKEEFVIATGSSKDAVNLLVRVQSGAESGWGASAPNPVTGETPETIEAFLLDARKRLVGADARNIPSIHRALAGAERNPAAMAGIDLAVHDLVGKLYGMPVCEMLSRRRESVETCLSIGIADLDTTLRRAREAVVGGFRALKIKVGLNLADDLGRVGAVREVVGDGVRVGVDCNQGYTVEEAKAFADALSPLSIEFMEQPVRADDWEGLRAVTRHSDIPVMADEAVKTPTDAERLARGRYAEMLNVKLMKCGGIYPAMQMGKVCSSAGIKIIVGCMSECQLSIAGGLHFALSQDIVDLVDLDSHFSMLCDPSSGVCFSDGRLFPSPQPGLGVDVNEVAVLFPFPYA